MNYKKILIINLAGIGDLLLSIPALKALRSSFPEARIWMLTSSKVYELAQNFEFIDKLVCLDLNYGGIIRRANFWGQIIGLIKLRMEKFDIAINMRTLVSDKSAHKMHALIKFIKPRKAAGRDTEKRGNFFDIKIPETQIGEKYESEYDIDLVEALGAVGVERKINFKVRESDLADIKQKLQEKNIRKDSIIIGIHPGGMPTRRWPIERFCQLIEQVGKTINCYFVITGGYNELSLGQRLVQILPGKTISFVNKLNIKQTAALISRCNVFITNDTGPMHIAAILKTPLIALLGPGDIKRFDPRIIFDQAKVFYNKQECAPCEQVFCDNMKCMKSIDTETVAKTVINLLKKDNNVG
ncbi:MAG: glycosyltransferase family 9 protein [Candidatus Omnitrophica bacterium]|nr:glycosyltransferase family 9 protein [Candidatus Omnitrophota bacterium]